MSRPKSGKTKRDGAVNLQAWFNPEDEADAAYLKVIEPYFEAGKSKKDVIRAAIEALAQFEAPEVLAAIETKREKIDQSTKSLEKVVAVLASMTSKMQSGEFVSSDSYEKIANDVSEQLGNIQASIGNNFETIFVEIESSDDDWD